MSEAAVAAGDGWRRWPDGTLMSRLDLCTGEELISLVPGIRYREGSVLINQGARDTWVYLLEPASPGSSACVKVTACLENGQETMLSIGVSGDVVGEQAVLARRERPATVVAFPDAVLIQGMHPDTAPELCRCIFPLR